MSTECTTETADPGQILDGGFDLHKLLAEIRKCKQVPKRIRERARRLANECELCAVRQPRVSEVPQHGAIEITFDDGISSAVLTIHVFDSRYCVTRVRNRDCVVREFSELRAVIDRVEWFSSRVIESECRIILEGHGRKTVPHDDSLSQEFEISDAYGKRPLNNLPALPSPR
jgi:hypothetical protein